MASVDSGVETSNDSNDSSATSEQQFTGPPASKSKEIILYQIPPLLTPSWRPPYDQLPEVQPPVQGNPWNEDPLAAIVKAYTRKRQERFRLPFLPSWQDSALPSCNSALPLSPRNDYLFSSDLTDCKRNHSGSYKLRRASTCCSLSASRGTRLHVSGGYYERKLRVAVMSNNIELVQNLLWIGVNPNSRDSHKRTPLHLAACRGYADIVRLLLDNNADPNQRDLLGNTPLHLAACTNNVVVVTLLLKAGTDVKSTDDYGRNPLQIAQSKLKLLQKLFSNDISAPLKNQVYQIIEMLREFLNRRGQDTEAELISSFSSRLTLSKTRDEVETQVRDLLASLPHLSLEDKKSSAASSTGESSNDSFASTSSATEASASSLVPVVDTADSFGANKESRPFSFRSAWWAPSIDAMCNCNLETCRACRNKAIFSVPTSTAVSSSGFESLME